jgi:hypothetical protein
MYLTRPTLFLLSSYLVQLSPVSLHRQDVCATQREERPGKRGKEGAMTAEGGGEKRLKQKRRPLISNSLYEKQFLNVGLSKEFQA